MEALSRNKKISIFFLVITSLTVVGLFGTGNIDISWIKSDIFNQSDYICTEKGQITNKGAYTKAIKSQKDTTNIINLNKSEITVLENKIVKNQTLITQKESQIEIKKSTIKDLQNYINRNCSGNFKPTKVCNQKKQQLQQMLSDFNILTKEVSFLESENKKLERQIISKNENIKILETRREIDIFFIAQYDLCNKQLSVRPIIKSELKSWEINMTSGDSSRDLCQTKITSGEVLFMSGEVQVPNLILGEILRVKNKNIKFSIESDIEKNFKIEKWYLKMKNMKTICRQEQTMVTCDFLPGSTIEPGDKVDFQLLGALGFIDSPLTITTKFVQFTYNDDRIDVENKTANSVLTYLNKTTPIQLNSVERMGDSIEVSYCKNSETCADLYTSDGNKLNTKPLFCSSSGTVSVLENDLVGINNGIKVKLKYENADIWSNEVTVSGECAPNPIPAGTEDVDGDGRIDGYDLYLKEEIVARRINPNLLHRVRTLTLKPEMGIINQADEYAKSSMTEYIDKDVRIWETEHQKKGHMRGVCDPPMINIKFKKNDLFPARSSIAEKPILKYQKIRAIPNCDSEAYYWSNSSGWFKGVVNRQLGEYFIFSTLRNIGITTVDVIDFGILSFENAGERYKEKKYDYMFLQRDNEEDDEIPFTKQFGLKEALIEDGGEEDNYSLSYGNWNPYHRLYSIPMYDIKKQSAVALPLEKNNALKYALMTEFAQITDRGLLHNEDYGQIKGSDLWKTIPYGFDLGMYRCSINTSNARSDLIGIINRINSIPDEVGRKEFMKALYANAKEIFQDKNVLYKMLAVVDQYPFEAKNSPGKQKLKDYIKITFYDYRTFIESREFADLTGQEYTAPLCISYFPFNGKDASGQLRETHNQECNTPKPAPDATVSNITIDPITVKIQKRTWDEKEERDEYMFSGSYSLTITAGEKDVKISKDYALIFGMPVKRENSDEKWELYLSSIYKKDKNMINEPGPYYIIPAGESSTIKGEITSYDYSYPSKIAPGTYTLAMTGIRFNPYSSMLPVTKNNTTTVTIQE